MTANKYRLEYIDIAKGIGIVLVVLGHCISSEMFINRWMASFRMPLFFFAAGLVFNSDKQIPLFFQRRFFQIIIPYIYFVIINILIKSLLNCPNWSYIDCLKYNLEKFLSTGALFALWFLPVLFLMEMVYICTIQFLKIKTTRAHLAILIASATIGALLNSYGFKLPFSILTILPALTFFGLGDLTKNLVKSGVKKVSNRVLIISTFILMLCSLGFCHLTSVKINMVNNEMQPAILAYLGSAIGISFMFSVCVLIDRFNIFFKPIFLYIGRKTLLILSTHMLLIFLMSYFFRESFSNHISYKIFEFASVWIMLAVIDKVVELYIPWLVNGDHLKLLIPKIKKIII